MHTAYSIQHNSQLKLPQISKKLLYNLYNLIIYYISFGIAQIKRINTLKNLINTIFISIQNTSNIFDNLFNRKNYSFVININHLK